MPLTRRASLSLLLALTGCASQAGVPGDMQTWNRPFPPYRVLDGIYYVGTNKIAQFLIVTSAGLILLDSGFEASVPQLRENIAALGFRYSDIKLLLTSHAHIDHVQAHALVRRETGARVVASALDAPLIEHGGKGDPLYDGVYAWTPSPVDWRVGDGERVTLGATTLTAHVTPGHTLGALTWTMQVDDGGRTLDVVFFPSANVNPGVHLLGHATYPGIVQDFERSFEVWKSLKCDVFLADHGEFYDMAEKYARLRRGQTPNPFIDPTGYRAFIDDAERRFRARLAEER
ncbi:MAG: subclass B3 metallo-beta-lactamase [Myxococcales bacterium]